MPQQQAPLVTSNVKSSVTVFLLTFGLYLLTMQPDISWHYFGGDGGELIAASVTLAAPHPPGYPTYIWLGKLFSYLPIEPVALRFHIFSAFSSALAASLITRLIHKEYEQRLIAVSVGLLVATTPLIWQQATIAEVYSLNLLVIALWLNYWWPTEKKPVQLGFWQGLALTTHLTSLLLLPLTFWRTPLRDWPKMGLGIGLGLTPYLTIPWLARESSLIVWGEPNTVSGFYWLVTGQLYQHQLLALPLDQWAARLGTWWPTLLLQFLMLGWFFLPRLLGKKEKDLWARQVGLVTVSIAYIGYGFLYNSVDAIIFTMPAILLLSIPLTTGWQLRPYVAVILPVIAVTLNFMYPIFGAQSEGPIDLRSQTIPILEKLPADALVLTPGDPTIFTLWYFQFAEQRRPDLIAIDKNLFGFDWYRARLKRVYPDLKGLDENDWVAFLAANEPQRQICQVALAAERPVLCPLLSDLGS